MTSLPAEFRFTLSRSNPLMFLLAVLFYLSHEQAPGKIASAAESSFGTEDEVGVLGFFVFTDTFMLTKKWILDEVFVPFFFPYFFVGWKVEGATFDKMTR